MSVGRTVTTQRRTAGLTGSQMNPTIARLDALLTFMVFLVLNGFDSTKMRADRTRCHKSSFTHVVLGIIAVPLTTFITF